VSDELCRQSTAALKDELFDDIEVDFGGVDLLIELWWELGRFHQLLVS